MKLLIAGTFAAALTLGSVTGVAAAAPGLPLEPATPATSAPRSVNDASTGSATLPADLLLSSLSGTPCPSPCL